MVQELRKFGLTTGGIFALLFGLFLPWLWGLPWPRWPWVVAGGLVLPAILYPPLLKPVHFVWMKFAHALGWINTRILLTLFYFLVITPFGWVMRALGRDPLKKHEEQGTESYRLPTSPGGSHRMEDPF